jgi:hypothetical protein
MHEPYERYRSRKKQKFNRSTPRPPRILITFANFADFARPLVWHRKDGSSAVAKAMADKAGETPTAHFWLIPIPAFLVSLLDFGFVWFVVPLRLGG